MLEIIVFAALALALLSAAISLILLFRLRNLALRQDGIVSELVEVSAAQKRILEQFHGLAHKQSILADKLAASGDRQSKDDVESAVRNPKAVKEDVLFLARQGLNAGKIAKDLNIPKGEVELILDLDKFSAQEE